VHGLLSLGEPYLVKKDYVLKVVGSWESFRRTTSIHFCRNLPMVTDAHGTLGPQQKKCPLQFCT